MFLSVGKLLKDRDHVSLIFLSINWEEDIAWKDYTVHLENESTINSGKELNTLYDELKKFSWETSEGRRGQGILRKNIGLNVSCKEWKNLDGHKDKDVPIKGTQ